MEWVELKREKTTVAIKALPCLYTCLKAEAASRYKTAMAIRNYSMLQANDIKEWQSTVEVAFKSSKPAPVSRRSGVMESGTRHLVRAKSWLYTNTAQTCNVQGMLFEVGGGQNIALQYCLKETEQSLKALRLETVMRRRGVPRRGGRSGVRYGIEGEEPHPIAPMAAISPSSSSSEEEFLLLPDSYQSFRLRIPRGILQSDVMVNFSVYLSEAPPINPSWSSPASDSLQSSEILLGDMQGRVHRMPRPRAPIEQVDQPQQAQNQANSIRDESVQEIQPLINCVQNRNAEQDSAHLGSEGHLQVDEESVIWLDPPSPMQRQPPTSPSYPT